MIDLSCNVCGKSLRVQNQYAGRRGKCPQCGELVKIPEEPTLDSTAEPPPPRPVTTTRSVQVEVTPSKSSLGITSLILGIVAFLFCWIPLVGLLTLPLSALGSLLGIAGIVVASRRQGSGVGFAIGGTAISGLALLLTLGMTAAIGSAMSSASQTYDYSSSTQRSGSSDDAAGVDTTPVLQVAEVSGKRFEAAEPLSGHYEDSIYFDVRWDTSNLPRTARAVKGKLRLMDLFGETMLTLNWTIDGPIEPGQPFVETGVGFRYNQFIESHQWVRSTPLESMMFAFDVDEILYVADAGD